VWVTREDHVVELVAGSWKWTMESKEFELLIRGKASRVRIFERNNKIQKVYISTEG
jgi:hypothetical protein